MNDPFMHRRRFFEAYEQVVARIGGWQKAGIKRSTWYSAKKLDHVPYDWMLHGVLSHPFATGEPIPDATKTQLYALRDAAQRERDTAAHSALPLLPERVGVIARRSADALTDIAYYDYMAAHADSDADARRYRFERDVRILRSSPALDAAGEWDALLTWGPVVLAGATRPERHAGLFQRLVNAHARRGDWASADAVLSQLQALADAAHNPRITAIACVTEADYALVQALHGFGPPFDAVEDSLTRAGATTSNHATHHFMTLIALGRIQRRCQRYDDAEHSFRTVANAATAPRHRLWAALAAGNLSIVNVANDNLRRAENGLNRTWKGVNHLVDFAEVHIVQAAIFFRRGDVQRYARWRIRGEQIAREMHLLHPTSSTHAELMRLSGETRLIPGAV